MSGMLDGLVTNEWRPDSARGPWVYVADVREALRSDEAVRAVLTETGWPETDVNVRDVQAVLDALAGSVSATHAPDGCNDRCQGDEHWLAGEDQ